MHPSADDSVIARIAGRQLGLVTYWQLCAAGLSRAAIAARVERGLLHRVHRGVYLVGHPVMPPYARELAAVLAYRSNAVASHASAIKLWQLLPRTADDSVHVTVPEPGGKSRPGVRVHQTRGMPPRTKRHGVPVTTAVRALLDFAEQASERELARAFYEALAQRRTSPPQLRKLLGDSPGRRGTRAIATLLETHGTPAITRHEAEDILFALIRKAGLPLPERNVHVGRHELDLFFRDHLLNVEIDVYRWHRFKFEQDRVRDAELQAMGIRVMRIPWRPLTAEPEAVLVRLAQTLSAGFAPRSVAAR